MDEDSWDDSPPVVEGLDDLDANLFGSSSLKKKAEKTNSTDDTPKVKSGVKKVQFKSSVDFDDNEDLLAGILSDDENEKPIKTLTKANKVEQNLDKDTMLPKNKVSKGKKDDNDFQDSDILSGLGFDDATSSNSRGIGKKEKSFMDQLLDSGDTSTKVKSSRKQFVLDDKYTATKDEPVFGLGSYSPSKTESTKKPSSRRNMLENFDSERKTVTTVAQNKNDKDTTSTGRRRSNLDWLGLGDDDKEELSDLSPSKQTPVDLKSQPQTRRQKALSSEWLGLEDDKIAQNEAPSSSFDKGTPGRGVKYSQEESSDWMDLKKKFEGKSQSTGAPTGSEEVRVAEITTSQSHGEPLAMNIHTSPSKETKQVVTSSHLVEQTESLDQLKVLRTESILSQIEKEHLSKALENTQLRYAEELNSTESFYKKQIKSMEEMHQEANVRLHTELETRVKELQFHVSELEMEKNKLLLVNQEKLERKEQQYNLEVQRLRELQSQAIMNLKQEHQDSLQRLQRLKEQEIEAISSTQEQTRSIQKVMEELEAKTVQLNQLQAKLESQHHENLDSRKAVLETKERQLKATEDRLKKLHEEGEEERARLQQLVLRLEKRLEEQTRELEEEKWRTIQEKGRLEVQRKNLDEEKNQFEHKMDIERNRLQQVKELVLQEHKSILMQMAQERQILVEREAQLRRKDEEHTRHSRVHLQEESRIEVDFKVLQQEKAYLETDKQKIHEESGRLQRERDILEREKRELQTEREKLHNLGLKLKKRSEEIEEMCLNSFQAREEGQTALLSAKELESEFGIKRNKISEQLQTLRAKERQIIHEKQLLVKEQQHLETAKKSVLCSNCHQQATLHQPNSFIPSGGMSELRSNIQQYQNPHSATLSQMILSEPSLLIWKMIAEKDKLFLEEESRYLESLRQGIHK